MIENPVRLATPIERVVRTKGTQQRDLAACLSPNPVLASGNLIESCVAARADLLVTSRIGSYDLTSVAAPSGFHPDRIGNVVAAVGTGPHSGLAAEVALLVARSVGCAVDFVTAAGPGEVAQAERVLATLAGGRPDAHWRVIISTDPKSVIASADSSTLLVVGAPGGNWFERQLLGTGARLRFQSPGGAVVVRNAPRRVFHHAQSPTSWVGPHLRVEDAPDLLSHAVVPVVDAGHLIGLVHREATLPPATGTIGDVMESPRSLTMADPADAVDDLADYFEGSPIPVIDEDERLVGVVAPAG